MFLEVIVIHIWLLGCTCAKKFLFIAGNSNKKGQYITLLKMALIRKMV